MAVEVELAGCRARRGRAQSAICTWATRSAYDAIGGVDVVAVVGEVEQVAQEADVVGAPSAATRSMTATASAAVRSG